MRGFNPMNQFTHHQLKTIFTLVRKRQEDCLRTYQYDEYKELNEILDILQPIAYRETYTEEDKNREYNLREAEYYNKRAQLDAEYNDIPDRY